MQKIRLDRTRMDVIKDRKVIVSQESLGAAQRFNYTRLPGGEERRRRARRQTRGCRFRAIRLKHPISCIQWISPFCLQTLSILAHKGVRLCAVQFGNYKGVEFPLINTVELNGERTAEENAMLKQALAPVP